MNAKIESLMIMAVVAVVLLATPAFAHVEYAPVPAGVWAPKPHAHPHDEPTARCNSEEFDLFAELGKAVTGLPNAIGNLLEAIFPSHKQTTEMEASRRSKYIDLPNASGVIVRIPAK